MRMCWIIQDVFVKHHRWDIRSWRLWIRATAARVFVSFLALVRQDEGGRAERVCVEEEEMRRWWGREERLEGAVMYLAAHLVSNSWLKQSVHSIFGAQLRPVFTEKLWLPHPFTPFWPPLSWGPRLLKLWHNTPQPLCIQANACFLRTVRTPHVS